MRHLFVVATVLIGCGSDSTAKSSSAGPTVSSTSVPPVEATMSAKPTASAIVDELAALPPNARRAEMVNRGKALFVAVKDAVKTGASRKERKGPQCFQEMREHFANLDAAYKPTNIFVLAESKYDIELPWLPKVRYLALVDAKSCVNCSEGGRAKCDTAQAEINALEPQIK